MLRSLLQLFESHASTQEPELTVELATASLLSEIIRADTNIEEAELEAYKKQLYRQFSLSQEALATLAKEGQASAEEAVDLVQFTQVINTHCDNQQKHTNVTQTEYR